VIIRRWKMVNVWCVSVFTFCFAFLSISPGFVQAFWETSQDLIEHQSSGSINWSSGSLVAQGIGIPPSSVSASAATAMAGRAAKAVALRNLLELVQGIRVDSTTTVKNYVVQSDEIQTRIQGLVKNAQEMKRAVFPDGSVEVTLSMALWGEQSLLSSLGTNEKRDHSFEDGSPDQNSFGYSGVVVDARGLAIKPVAYPSLLDPQREAILAIGEDKRPKTPSRGGAQYLMLKDSLSLSSLWRRHPVVDKKETGPSLKRVGPRPLTIKGLDKAGTFQADIIVSASDAKKLREDENLLKVLREGRIIIVTDPLIAGVEGSLPRSTTIIASVISSDF
jgi:hypothetical protein